MAGGVEATAAARRPKAPALGNWAVRPDLGGRRGIGVGAFVLALVTAGAMAHVAVRMKGIEVAYELGHERRTAEIGAVDDDGIGLRSVRLRARDGASCSPADLRRRDAREIHVRRQLIAFDRDAVDAARREVGWAPVRFDGVERIQPESDDIAAHRAAVTARRLVDLITADKSLCAQITAALWGGGHT